MSTVLVTPTYTPDLERCKLLLKSCDKYVSGVDRHLLLVDECELKVFKPLVSDAVELVSKESVLSTWVRRFPLSSRWWMSGAGLPVRGWILQQIVKLAIAEHYQCDNLLFADSDVVFVRSFHTNDLCEDGKVRLYRRTRGPLQYRDRRYRNWYRVAARLAGVSDPSSIDGSYIAQLNCWRSANVAKLYQRIEEMFSCRWDKKLMRIQDFSEFVIYGAFVEKYLGLEESGHYLCDRDICHSSWFYDINSEYDAAKFVQDARASHSAVHLQSNLNLKADLLASIA